MRTSSKILAVLLPAALAACVVESAEPPEEGEFGPGFGTSEDAGIYGDGAASAKPMRAFVDSNETLTSQPGAGIGVFAEYGTGGHWNVFWTCDTTSSGDSCPFVISVTASEGEVSSATSQGFEGSDSLVAKGNLVTANTTTTLSQEGMTFDTDPGATITLSASLGGEYSGAFLFFIQDDKVNGGYTGELTDPLELTPSQP